MGKKTEYGKKGDRFRENRMKKIKRENRKEKKRPKWGQKTVHRSTKMEKENRKREERMKKKWKEKTESVK